MPILREWCPMETINLRPHHLLCICTFYGLGYSHHFVEAFKEIKKKIDDDNVRIRLICGEDDICTHCPHRETCPKLIFTKLLDAKVLRATGLMCERTYSTTEIYSIIDEVVTSSVLELICKDCAFYNYCKSVYEQRREELGAKEE
ncbi:MAG TPA: DUF1284 domain-containing protein [Methanomicrobia archaeon]|nr:DUF1284 domain-containing protein [Methanomicrobia archaeon]